MAISYSMCKYMYLHNYFNRQDCVPVKHTPRHTCTLQTQYHKVLEAACVATHTQRYSATYRVGEGVEAAVVGVLVAAACAARTEARSTAQA